MTIHGGARHRALPLAGVRVDRGVAMLADVSRAVGGRVGRRRPGGGRRRGGDRPAGACCARAPDSPSTFARPGGAARGGRGRGPASRWSTPTTEVVVVDKPAGLVVHPGAGHARGHPGGRAPGPLPGPGRAGRSGRLPTRPARHRAPARQGHLGAPGGGPHRAGPTRPWSPSWPTRTMERRYLALVEGTVADDRGEIEAPIGRSTRTPTKMAVSPIGRAGPHRLHRAWNGALPPPPRGHDPARAQPAERAHPPDPGPHGGHRPPGRGRRPLRAPRTRRLGSAAGSSCMPSSWPSPIRGDGSPLGVLGAAARRTWRRTSAG